MNVNHEAMIARAKELGGTYFARYHNCAQASFAAIMDGLREADITLTSQAVEEVLFCGLAGFSGGHANTSTGSCGALVGASVVMSLISGVGAKEQAGIDKNGRWVAFDNVAKTVGNDFKTNFHGTTCKAVLWERYGMWWDFWTPEIYEGYLEEMKKLGGGCLAGTDSTIALAAGWGMKAVLECLENPRTVEQVVREHNLVVPVAE